MDTINGERLLAQLNWRYATKEFDPSRKISLKDWAALENALILSPSSYGLQPWRFVVISDQKMREKLFPSTWRQRQVLDCSHFVVFAVRTAMTETDIDRHIARTAEVRGGTEEALKRFRDVMVGDVVSGPRAAQALDWGARQAYLALGTFMTSAALMGIDTCPMEGFDPMSTTGFSIWRRTVWRQWFVARPVIVRPATNMQRRKKCASTART